MNHALLFLLFSGVLFAFEHGADGAPNGPVGGPCVGGRLSENIARAIHPIGSKRESICLLTAISDSVGITASHCLRNRTDGGLTVYPELVESVGFSTIFGDKSKAGGDAAIEYVEELTHDVALVYFPKGTFKHFLPYSTEDETRSNHPNAFRLGSKVALVHYDHDTLKMDCAEVTINNSLFPMPSSPQDKAKAYDDHVWEISQQRVKSPVMVGYAGDSGGPMIDSNGVLRGVIASSTTGRGEPFSMSYYNRLSSPISKTLLDKLGLQTAPKLGARPQAVAHGPAAQRPQEKPDLILNENETIIYSLGPDLSLTPIPAKGVIEGRIYIVAIRDASGKVLHKSLRRFTLVEQPAEAGELGRTLSKEIPVGTLFRSADLGWEGESLDLSVSRIEGLEIYFKKHRKAGGERPRAILEDDEPAPRPRAERPQIPQQLPLAPEPNVQGGALKSDREMQGAVMSFLADSINEEAKSRKAKRSGNPMKTQESTEDLSDETPNERATRLREEEEWRDLIEKHDGELKAMRRHSGQEPGYDIDFSEYKRGSKVQDATRTSMYALKTGGLHIEFYDIDVLGNPQGRTKLAIALGDWNPLTRSRLSEPYRERGGKQTHLDLDVFGRPTGLFKQLIDAGEWDFIFMKRKSELTRQERQYYIDRKNGKFNR